MRAAPRLALIAIVAAACGARPASRLPGGAAPVFRGHRDVRVGPAGVLPWVVGRSAPVGFCLDVPPERDTSQWTARLFDDGSIAPSVRLGSTLCFEAKLPSAWTDGDRELCAEVRDGFDGSTLRLPCLPFRFDADDAALRTLESRLATAMREPIASLDALSRDAEVQGFPGLALRTRLVGAYVLRRTGIAEARANVARRISQAPAWVEQKDRRGVMLAGLDLEFGGGSRDLLLVAVEAKKVLVKRTHILGQHVGLVVPWIHRDEDDLHAPTVVPEEVDDLSKRCHGEGADVRAVRKTEIDRNHLAAEIGELVGPAVVAGQAKVTAPRYSAHVGRLERERRRL